MQALDVADGPSSVTALAVHPSFRMVGCGFSNGDQDVFAIDGTVSLEGDGIFGDTSDLATFTGTVGDGSLEGFMGIGKKRPGLTGVHVKTHIKSSATTEELQELHDDVVMRSPIRDTIMNPVTVFMALSSA